MENNKNNFTTAITSVAVVTNPSLTADDPDSTTADDSSHTTNTTLHRQFMRLGKERNKITYKLLFLLPKIAELEIYKKHNYSSIYEYAGKLAGLSYSVVEKALAVHKNLKGKPFLQKAVESEGIHKVALVAKLANPKTDAAWADKVKNMSKHSLCELAREVRLRGKSEDDGSVSGTDGNNRSWSGTSGVGMSEDDRNWGDKGGAKDGILTLSSLCHAAPGRIKIELDEEMQFLFLKLKKSMMRRGVKIGSRLSNKEVLKRILKEAELREKQSVTGLRAKQGAADDQRKAGLSTKFSRGWNKKERREDVKQRDKQGEREGQGKQTMWSKQNVQEKCDKQEKQAKRKIEIQKTTPTKSTAPNTTQPKQAIASAQPKTTPPKTTTRYIPVHQKKAALQRSGDKCAYPNCQKPTDVFHHTKRFSETKSHQSVTPLCKAHHEFAHSGLIENEEMEPCKWRLKVEAGVFTYADTGFRHFRRE